MRYHPGMDGKLIRYQQTGSLHFLTISCAQRRKYLASPAAKELFEHSLETMRARYDFQIFGYVVMPEHVHLLLTEPKQAILAKAIQALKLSVSVQQDRRPFWLTRYYDFNVFTGRKFIEKILYMHRNPVARGLVERAEDWPWSSFLHYSSGDIGSVEIESGWTTRRRELATNPNQI